MKKLIILLLLAAAGYWGYQNIGAFTAGPSFDGQGRPRVILFTMEACGAPCGEVAGELRSRSVDFEEVDVATDEGRRRIEKLGVRQVPLTVIGNRKVLGNDMSAIESALAEAYGFDALNPAQQEVMRNHFDEQGNPRVVMYGTTACSYCRRLQAYLDGRQIPYLFMDVAGSSNARYDFDVLRGRGYPLTYVGYRRIDGYSESAVNEAVKQLMKR